MENEQPEQAATAAKPGRFERLWRRMEQSAAFSWYERHKRVGPPLFFFGGVLCYGGVFHAVDRAGTAYQLRGEPPP